MKLNARPRISPSVMRLYETSHTLSELNTQQDHQELSTQRYTRQKWLDHISFTPHLDLSYPPAWRPQTMETGCEHIHS